MSVDREPAPERTADNRVFTAGECVPKSDAALPPVPGGWTLEQVRLGERTIRLTLPADPDRFLDEPDILAPNRRDGPDPYWANLWPPARKMAALVAEAKWPPGMRALEIGCGIGLVGLAGLSNGLVVTFTDIDPLAVRLAAFNAAQNGFRDFDQMRLDWMESPSLRFPLILGCDIVYEVRSHAPILKLLEKVLSRDGCCWIGDAGRQAADEFVSLARNRGFLVDLRDEGGRRRAETCIGRFQLIVLRRSQPEGG